MGLIFRWNMMSRRSVFYCPVCGKYKFIEGPGSYEICPICKWEDDLVQEKDPSFKGGANVLSLNEYRNLWRKSHEEK